MSNEKTPVAYLHQVVCGDGEPDQALSFEPDNFPLSGVLGYRSLSHEPLFLGAATRGPNDAGPREHTVTTMVCDGCPMLHTEWWKDYLDNDETDSGTSATCNAEKRNITAYWHPLTKAPKWCPHLTHNAKVSGGGAFPPSA